MMPPAVKWLIIANVSVFLLQNIIAAAFRFPIAAILGLNANAVLHGMVWQLATYMFLHLDLMHILWNMFALWMFGRDIEQTGGTRSFLSLYFFSGVGAGLLSFLTSLGSNTTTIGASGAIFGILVAFGMMFPNRIVLVFFMFPMRARNFVILFGLLELYMTVSAGAYGGGIARFAHLGGILFGYIYVKYGHTFRFSLPKIKVNIGSARRQKKEEDWLRFIEEEVDPILDKISREGIHTLSRKERKILKKARGRRRDE